MYEFARINWSKTMTGKITGRHRKSNLWSLKKMLENGKNWTISNLKPIWKPHLTFLLCVVSQGLYCISVNCMDNAEAQFTTALRVSARWLLHQLCICFDLVTCCAAVVLCSCHQVTVCVAAHHTPGAVDVHSNQPGQCVHQGRNPTPGCEQKGIILAFLLWTISM